MDLAVVIAQRAILGGPAVEHNQASYDVPLGRGNRGTFATIRCMALYFVEMLACNDISLKQGSREGRAWCCTC